MGEMWAMADLTGTVMYLSVSFPLYEKASPKADRSWGGRRVRQRGDITERGGCMQTGSCKAPEA